jgi:transposase
MKSNKKELKEVGKTGSELKSDKTISTGEKIRIVAEGMYSEISISDLCHREGIDSELYYQWCKNFLQNDKGRFVVDIKKEDTSFNVFHFENENILLKYFVEELKVENNALKRRLSGTL